MAPVRISIITETFVPDVNGVANSLRQLVAALDPERFCVQLIRTRPRETWLPEVDEVWCSGLTIPMYPDLQIGLPARRRIADAWQVFEPQLVFIATEGPLGYSALALARRMDLPVISAFHTNFHRYSSYYGMGWIKTLTLGWLRRFHNHTALTLVPSGDMADDLRALQFRNVDVLPHGVDCLHFSPDKRSSALRCQWRNKGPVMLYVGRIAAEKNIPLAIRCWQHWQQSCPGLTLVMVGDGPMRVELERQYPEVIFMGVQTGAALSACFASADLFVFPSLTETFGLVTLEAMASGLPVVAFDMAAAHRYVRPGIEGELAAPDDDQGFVEAVGRLLASDLIERSRLARACAEGLSWETVANRFGDFVDSQLMNKSKEILSRTHTLV